MVKSSVAMITSTKNQKIINLRKLSQRKHRRAQNQFVVEGLQLLGMALDGGHTPLDVFFCAEDFAGDTAPTLLRQLRDAGGALQPVSQAVMRAISERDAPQGIVATFPLFETPVEAILDPGTTPALLVVLDRLQDPGNLGTLIRTADAVSAGGVILLEPCVDPFDPKTVRGSMGSLFTVPLVRAPEPAALFDVVRQHGYKITGADGYQGKLAWAPNSKALAGRVALVLGNEARGLSLDVRARLTHWVRLPLLGQAESLNVAVAGGVLMYQWVQRNLWIADRWMLGF